MEHLCIYKGKVRDVYMLGDEYLLMKATDRVSSFDKNVGVIPGKGVLLNKMSQFWFNKTKHIIDNHLLSVNDNVMLVKRCIPFKIEVVVRGYITGNTSTSLWTQYNSGVRNYCGISLPEGFKKNQKLPEPIITPTTKGITDKPMSKEELIEQGYISEEECNYVFKKAMELFLFGQKLVSEADLILVDTKYEFGKTLDGKIILIDEVHTCDSSRYWKQSSYQHRFSNDLEPEKFDKDLVRDWLKSNNKEYISDEIVKKTYEGYKQFYAAISSIKTPSPTNNLIVIISGSESDYPHINKLIKCINKESLSYVSYVASAHKDPRKVLQILDEYKNKYLNTRDRKIVFVTIAGKSNALSGMVAANSIFPVIACPYFATETAMILNIHSTLQCPRKVPVMTVLEPENVVLCIKKMWNIR